MRLNWLETVAMLRSATERRGGRAVLDGGSLTLSSPTGGAPITVTDQAADGVLVEAGWVIRLIATCEEDEHMPPDVLYLVEAIMDGGAEESAIAADDRHTWADVSFIIRTPYGPAGSRSGASHQLTRSLPAWPDDRP